MEQIGHHTFDTVGVCIYCGSDGGQGGIRTEHIMPFSLGGNAKLPEARCSACETVTAKLDGTATLPAIFPTNTGFTQASKQDGQRIGQPKSLSDF